MANRLVSVNDALQLPPAVRNQLKIDVEADVAGSVTTAQNAATAASTSRNEAQAAAVVAQEAADEAVAIVTADLDPANAILIADPGSQTREALDERALAISQDVRLGSEYPESKLSVLRDAMEANGSARVVTLGSSTIGGGGATEDGLAFVARLAYRSGASGVLSLTASDNTGTGVQWYQGAIGGATSATYFPSGHLTRVSALQPKIVFHMVGSNDAATGIGPSTYTSNLRPILESIESAVPGVLNILVHAHERIDTTLTAPWSQYGDALAALASENPTNRVLVNLMDYVNVRGTRNGNRWGLVGSDGIHLVDKAHKLYADIFSVLLNLPTENDEAPTRYKMTLPASGTVYTSNTVLGTVAIPSAPYPREVQIIGHLSVQVAVNANEIQVGLDGAAGVAAANLPQPINDGFNRSVGISESFYLPPLNTGSAFVRIAPTGNFRVSGQGVYSNITVEVRNI